MAKSVEEMLMQMLGEAKGGSAEVEGAKEFKLLKERNVSISLFPPCVWTTRSDYVLPFALTATSPGCLVIVYSLRESIKGRMATQNDARQHIYIFAYYGNLYLVVPSDYEDHEKRASYFSVYTWYRPIIRIFCCVLAAVLLVRLAFDISFVNRYSSCANPRVYMP
jgi:hypothetical protein